MAGTRHDVRRKRDPLADASGPERVYEKPAGRQVRADAFRRTPAKRHIGQAFDAW
jgi:hypothetical protein